MRTTVQLREGTEIAFDEDFGLGDLTITEVGGLATITLSVIDDDVLLAIASACTDLHMNRSLRRIAARRCYHPECHDEHGHSDGCVREAVQS